MEPSDIRHWPRVVERFLGYTQIVTTADSHSPTYPSTPGQWAMAKALFEELKTLGIEDVTLTPEGIVYAKLPATPGFESSPTLGLIAHIDTSPDVLGGPVNYRIARFIGDEIVLNGEYEIVLSPNDYPELLRYKGQEIIVTDGQTLLGADDKAGVAVIVSVLETLVQNPSIPHGPISVAFTADEEISRGTETFDLAKFGADFAFTIDGGEMGALESETFNAAIAKITFKGVPAHPGNAKGKMVNASTLLNDFLRSLPRDQTPERTEGYQGYFHLIRIEGTVEKASAIILVRDHDRDAFEVRKSRLAATADDYNRNGRNVCSIRMKDQYYNMKDALAKCPDILNLARVAMESCGVMPVERPVRGGTDGARLTQMGLPCPNLFTGAMNPRSVFEYLPVKSLVKSYEVVLELTHRASKLTHLKGFRL